MSFVPGLLIQMHLRLRDWFEEMRKQRIAELKREVSKSDETIVSLESKLKSLELEEANSNSNHIESHLPRLDSNGIESFAKETTFKDEQSAGSFTEDKDKDIELEKTPEFRFGQVVTTKKRRGLRRRKDCTNALKEVSVGENENLAWSNVIASTDKLTIDRAQATKDENLMEIFNSITESESAGVFRHRMDSQKRARYRKIINEHLDLGTIRSRITSKSITSSKELFRDLLLLANNALVFYSSRTREHKSALSLRNSVMEEYKKQSRGTNLHEATSSTFNLCNRPVKPRSARPRPRTLPCNNNEVLEKLCNADQKVKEEALEKPCDQSDNNVSSSKDKKTVRRPGVKVKTSTPKLRRRARK